MGVMIPGAETIATELGVRPSLRLESATDQVTVVVASNSWCASLIQIVPVQWTSVPTGAHFGGITCIGGSCDGVAGEAGSWRQANDPATTSSAPIARQGRISPV